MTPEQEFQQLAEGQVKAQGLPVILTLVRVVDLVKGHPMGWFMVEEPGKDPYFQLFCRHEFDQNLNPYFESSCRYQASACLVRQLDVAAEIRQLGIDLDHLAYTLALGSTVLYIALAAEVLRRQLRGDFVGAPGSKSISRSAMRTILETMGWAGDEMALSLLLSEIAVNVSEDAIAGHPGLKHIDELKFRGDPLAAPAADE